MRKPLKFQVVTCKVAFRSKPQSPAKSFEIGSIISEGDPLFEVILESGRYVYSYEDLTRSKPLIVLSYESLEQEPVEQEPVEQEPVEQEPVEQYSLPLVEEAEEAEEAVHNVVPEEDQPKRKGRPKKS